MICDDSNEGVIDHPLRVNDPKISTKGGKGRGSADEFRFTWEDLSHDVSYFLVVTEKGIT